MLIQEELTFLPTMVIDRVEMLDAIVDRIDNKETQMLNEVRMEMQRGKELTNEVVG